jgi:hypothetical protein
MYNTTVNFLEKDFFNYLQKTLLSNEFSWYYSTSQVKDKKDGYYFFHNFYCDDRINSGSYNSLIIPILNKLNIKKLINIRANLVLKKDKQFSSDLHIDHDFEHTTAILYINTNNGYTELEKDIKIPCEENKMLIFNGKILHKAVSQTDEDRRIVINFNYL